MINIPTHITDPGHRYKMHKMNLKVEGKGNGIMTNITNLEEIAKELRVPPSYPLKFFAMELGAISKTKSGWIINGKRDMDTMMKLLDKFIAKYILCPVCQIPEMTLTVSKDSIKGMCRSCGKTYKLDSTHKIFAHMVKNPPKDTSEFKEKGKKKETKSGKYVEVEEKKEKKGKSLKNENQDEPNELIPEALTLKS